MTLNRIGIECPVLPGYFFTRDGMFSVASADGPYFKGYRCLLSGRHYRRLKTVQGDFKFVHRMVGYTFCPNPLPDVFVICDHINGLTEDNRAENLRWVTQQLNVANSSARNAFELKKRPMTVNGRRIWINNKSPRWESRVTMEGKVHRLGTFSTEEAACRCSRSFREKKFEEIYLRILKEHEVDPETRAPFDIQPLRPPSTPPGPVFHNPPVQWPREGRRPRMCFCPSHAQDDTVPQTKKKDSLHKIEIWPVLPDSKKS